MIWRKKFLVRVNSSFFHSIMCTHALFNKIFRENDLQSNFYQIKWFHAIFLCSVEMSELISCNFFEKSVIRFKYIHSRRLVMHVVWLIEFNWIFYVFQLGYTSIATSQAFNLKYNISNTYLIAFYKIEISNQFLISHCCRL